MKKHLFLLLSVCLFFNGFAQKLKSPSEFLGYNLGSQFTPHYKIVDYFDYLGKTSKNIKVIQFGTTNEGRPLFTAFIGTEANIYNLEEIRKNNLRLAGMETGTANTNTPAIVWLSYNVHGNEPSSSEAAMQTAFNLINPDNAESKKWLTNTLVVIDPCLNPDGRERYVNFYNPVHSALPDANPSSREHMEPWPGGRVNHYYFDLNRDWAWQTQRETQARLALYNHWLPQIHVDYHEQGYNNPYYFAPAAEPFHKVITKWQKDFQTVIGKNNAKYFDRNNWMYFTKEEFDLLYPSYGDTYPLYNGAIGMTYEQGGIAAGLGVVTRDGDTLTLGQRINHHIISGLSTVEIASANAEKLVTEFKKFFSNSVSSPTGDFKGYVVKNDNADKIETLAQLLDRNGIQYGFGGVATAPGFNYFTGTTEAFTIGPNDMVIDAHQPKSVLLSVLFEPKTFMTDSNTYDITAWALPYAFGLKTYGLKQSVKFQASAMPVTPDKPITTPQPYAYVSQWKSMADVRFLAALLKLNVKVRYAERPFEAGGKSFEAGSLIITHAGNSRPNFDQLIQQTAQTFERSLTALNSGFVDKGADFGSAQIRYITKPRIMMVAGEGISSGSVGEVWQLFEQQIGYPVTLVRLQDLNRIKWSDFDVAILPDGNGYDNAPFDKIQAWVRDGGKLIAMESAAGALVDKKGFNLKAKAADKKDDKDKKTISAKDITPYEDRDREAIKNNIPGAIYKLTLDNTHPLAFGLPKFYYTLKQGDDLYDFLGDGDWNVGIIKKDAYQAGFVGQKAKAKLSEGMLLGVQSAGRGTVVYMADDPLFRSFWENGKLLFSNAVFMVGK